MKIKEKTKSIPIRFNADSLTKITELSNLMGVYGSYGEVSKVLRFSLEVSLAAIKNPEKLYMGLNQANHEIYLYSIAKHQKREKLKLEAENLLNQAKNV